MGIFGDLNFSFGDDDDDADTGGTTNGGSVGYGDDDTLPSESLIMQGLGNLVDDWTGGEEEVSPEEARFNKNQAALAEYEDSGDFDNSGFDKDEMAGLNKEGIDWAGVGEAGADVASGLVSGLGQMGQQQAPQVTSSLPEYQIPAPSGIFGDLDAQRKTQWGM